MRITVNETTPYFDVEGVGLVPDGQTMRERPTILALHGGPGFDHAYFKPALSVLADFAQVLYLDLRGQGRSDHPPINMCTLEQMADDVAEFCRMLGIACPVVLGHSAGGFVASHLAIRHPEVAGRLVLLNTTASTVDQGDVLGRLELRCGEKARAAAERMFGGDFSPDSMADFGHLVLPAHAHNPATAGAVFEALGRSTFSADVASFYFGERAEHYDLRGRLSDISVPALVMVGESDWLCPPSASRTMAASIPDAELVEIPKAGHFTFSEQTVPFSETVRRFLMAG